MFEIFTNCGTIPESFFTEPAKILCAPDITHSHIPFVHQMFCRWGYQPAQQYSWVMVIEAHNKEYLLSRITGQIKKIEPPGWGVDRIVEQTWNDYTQNIIGCIFAQGVELPGEKVKTELVGITEGSNRGFINSPIINGRQGFEPLLCSFLETNQSFVDGCIRPWSILVSHEGLIARPRNQSIKADIHIYQLAKAGEDRPNIIRKAWIFKDCVPIDVSSEKLDYQSNDFGKRQATFVYNSYHINQDQQSNC